MEYGYNLTQDQKLALTQEMKLSIKVLQMSANDLREFIDNEFSENPVLEIKEDYTDNTQDSNKELDKYDYKEMIKYLEFDNYGGQSFGSYDDEVSPFNFISEKKSLKEYLHEQLADIEEDSFIKGIADYIIESLDSRGYLEISIDEIARELQISSTFVEKSLEVVQELEPYGIGARNLKECLKLQLIHLGLINEILEGIVDNYLEDLANNKYKSIGDRFNISQREAQRYGDLIKKLEPKPSSGFYTGEDVKFIMPDAEIKNIQGEYYIIMNDKLIPSLSINNTYKQVINSGEKSDTSKYVKEKLDKALFLIKSIEQRRSTLYNVLEKVVEKQKEFFDRGLNFLKPMTLKDISEEIQVHESTVSRAIKDKYILTTFGTIRIKEIFSTGVASKESSEDVSVVKIKNKIKALIDVENKMKPLSDQHICDELNKEDMNISRRTVAKYREEMEIKASSKRKRL